MDLDYICTGCLANHSLIEYVKRNSVKKLRKCHICGSRNVLAIDVPTLAEYMSSCISHNYSSLESRDGTDYDQDRDCFYYIDTDEEVEITNIFEIVEENDVLTREIEQEKRIDIYKSIFSCVYPKLEMYDDLAETGWVHARSNDLYHSWETFNYLIQNNNRFFESRKSNRYELLSKIIDNLSDYEEDLPSGTVLYRVRCDNSITEETLDDKIKTLKEISPPPCKLTKSYRMSPKGISYTYLSEDVLTCLKECNTKIHDRVLIGQFKTVKDLTILNLEIKDFPYYDLFSGNLDREKQNLSRFIEAYCEEISKPVEQDSDYEYLATQVIAEYIRFMGYDGISYSSAKNGRKNYVLFYGPDYMTFPEIRPDGWSSYIDSVPSFTKALDFIEYALCEVLNSRSHRLSVIKASANFKME